MSQCEFSSIHSYQDTVFPIYNFQYIKKSNLLSLFIDGNSNTDILFFQKKSKFLSCH